MADAQAHGATAPTAKKGAFHEAEQTEKAYQIQKGHFVFGKAGTRRINSRRTRHVSTAVDGSV
eukprot:30505-Eustigmatos_ZCMA.PRE.1